MGLIGGDDPAIFTHIVINLPSPEEVIALTEQIMTSVMRKKLSSSRSGISGGSSSSTVAPPATTTNNSSQTLVIILSDSVQRQNVMKLAMGTEHEPLLSETQVTFVNKPVKPSRFAVIFDPDKVRDLSTDRNRSTAQRMVETQKQSYQEIEARMGNKGYRVLLVEDNPVNQKVLRKYLRKVGVDVDVAADGVECTDMVFSHDYGYWSLILVSTLKFRIPAY
jgi:PleD family two-component response regulator